MLVQIGPKSTADTRVDGLIEKHQHLVSEINGTDEWVTDVETAVNFIHDNFLQIQKDIEYVRDDLFVVNCLIDELKANESHVAVPIKQYDDRAVVSVIDMLETRIDGLETAAVCEAVETIAEYRHVQEQLRKLEARICALENPPAPIPASWWHRLFKRGK